VTIGRRHILGACALLLVAGGVAAALWWPTEPAAPTLRPDDPQVVARGAAIYAAQCAACHGARLEGQPNWRTRRPDGKLPAPPHDATGHSWHHADALLFDLTKKGPAAMIGGNYQTDMPGYAGTLSDTEIVAVLSYIKSRWPPAIRARHDMINRRSK